METAETVPVWASLGQTGPDWDRFCSFHHVSYVVFALRFLFSIPFFFNIRGVKENYYVYMYEEYDIDRGKRFDEDACPLLICVYPLSRVSLTQMKSKIWFSLTSSYEQDRRCLACVQLAKMGRRKWIAINSLEVLAEKYGIKNPITWGGCHYLVLWLGAKSRQVRGQVTCQVTWIGGFELGQGIPSNRCMTCSTRNNRLWLWLEQKMLTFWLRLVTICCSPQITLKCAIRSSSCCCHWFFLSHLHSASCHLIAIACYLQLLVSWNYMFLEIT